MAGETDGMWSWHDTHNCSRLINVSGTMTSLGGSITSPAVQEETAAIMGEFVNMHELQAHASRAICDLTGAEAGCVTASASAGISLAIAASMTGLNPGRVEALPKDPGEKNEVIVQLGHLCGYGAPVSQAVDLTGATVRPVGQSTHVMDYQLESALNEKTAAALYVVSHHVVHYGQIPFARFAEICHRANVPVIVDAASEYDLTGFIDQGADIVIYSGHKFLGGPTSGLIAGRRDLVRAAYLQNMGIGRGMKVGKESIAGAIAALRQWQRRDHEGIRRQERAALELWQKTLSAFAGIDPVIVPDPTGNPLERLQVHIDAQKLGASAATVARALGEQEPRLIVRNHEVELGYFQLDPCNLKPGQAELAAEILGKVCAEAGKLEERADDYHAARNGGVDPYLNWLS
ncbi:aminotransferase class V-fold PLP-dependent enzyme [Nitratireductor aquimarinus]|uniref:aminotransferase class V-fold PLP-dependent enzyme n=1 Tax=Nitratireductor aquimarinus TaxID=889300 RepID=UPI001CD38C31|nr:aminotransferase class V-fold PLP-dependent enzyme [Nitratireductor aquimarinus]MCA1304577.1 aminotransferase class V-fold PLP-dependent enzyme [Nitratireductor aquimarinus]